MQLCSQAVKHAAFGKGIITEVSGHTITVCFAQGEKRFSWPDAFTQYLTMKDTALQAELSAMAERNERDRQEEKQRELEKHERLIRLKAMKIPAKAQAAFDVDAPTLARLEREGVLYAGSYLSGPSKGKPRMPKSMKPNTACALTQVPAGGKEADRQILGVCMVQDDFWGDACEDGWVKAHETYRLMLPEPIPFWAFFEEEERRAAWGSVPFRYFANTTMRAMLREIADRLADGPQAQAAEELYGYFCDMNQMVR